MNPTIYFLLAVAVSAVITFGLRALPFFFFRGEKNDKNKNDKNMPDWLLQLGIILPSAIMAVLIVYCLRGAKSDFVGSGIPGFLSVAVVAFSYKWKHNTFVSILLGTTMYMILVKIL